MGYWATSAEGGSFVEGDTNADGEQMLWGDAPADAIDDGTHKLIERMHGELGRYPTVEEVDTARLDSDEMVEAIAKAVEVFTEDVERAPSEAELMAGLAFSNTKIALDSFMEGDLHVGDKVKWAGRADNGQFVWVTTDGEHWVPESPYDDHPEGARVWLRTGTLLSDPKAATALVAADNGESVTIGNGWVSRVLPEDLTADDVAVN